MDLRIGDNELSKGQANQLRLGNERFQMAFNRRSYTLNQTGTKDRSGQTAPHITRALGDQFAEAPVPTPQIVVACTRKGPRRRGGRV
jgi:hypothetical protein